MKAQKIFFYTSSIALIVIALSVTYYLVVRPITADLPYRECVDRSERGYEIKIKTGVNPIEASSDLLEEKEQCYRVFN